MANMTSESRNSTIFKSWQQSISETCLTWRCMVKKLVSLQLTAASTHLQEIRKREMRRQLEAEEANRKLFRQTDV